MSCWNVTISTNAIKRTAWYGGLIVVLLGLFGALGCSKDPTEVIDSTYDYSGTYVATYAVENVDGENKYDYGGSNITGLLVIQDTVYSLRIAFAFGSSYFGRTDAGSLIINDGYVDFSPVADTLLQSTARGYYDPAKEELKISYIWENRLWTEYWKAATPVDNVDTTTYIPF